MDRFLMKTSSMKGQMPFKEGSVLDKTNSRITLSNESAADDTDKIGATVLAEAKVCCSGSIACWYEWFRVLS